MLRSIMAEIRGLSAGDRAVWEKNAKGVLNRLMLVRGSYRETCPGHRVGRDHNKG